MDNHGQDFARKIIGILDDIKRLIIDAQAKPRQHHESSDKQTDESNRGERQAKTNTQGPPTTPKPTGASENPAQSNRRRFEKLSEFKPLVDIVGVGFLVIYTGVTVFLWSESRKANGLARESIQIAQRAYVTVGRKDGVVADFVIPKDAKQNAEIIIYFQNSGRLPAKFTWQTMGNFLIHGEGAKHTGITYIHRKMGGLFKTRDKKSGGISAEEGETSVIAGDSVFVSTLGIISQKDLAELPTNEVGLLIPGMFEYCDELGNHILKYFILDYRSNAPSSSLSFILVNETTLPTPALPKSTATTEYLPSCETSAEQEQGQKKTAKP